jgi:hypothetical protein
MDGRRALELEMLATMRGRARVERALASLGADPAEVAAARAQVEASGALAGPLRFEPLRRLLGEPDDTGPGDGLRYRKTAAFYRLPTWEPFRLAVFSDEAGVVGAIELVRVVPGPIVLEPWGAVEGDFAGASLEVIDDWFPMRDRRGRLDGAERILRFDWGLLQEIA